MKRSAGWAVIRNEAPVMPWDEPGRMDWILADTMRRMAAVRGSAAVLFFANESLELFGRLGYGDDGEMSELDEEDKRPIVTDFYAELVELHGEDHAQRFLAFWIAVADRIESHRKGAIASAAHRRQINRVARR